MRCSWGRRAGLVIRRRIRATLARLLSLQDLGISIRALPSGRGAVVESARLLLDEPVARAAFDAAAGAGLDASGVFSYLANTIRANGREIPYSVIAAADLGQGALTAVQRADAGGSPAPIAADESIWLNEWASRDLRASPGDLVEVDYYRWQDSGRLSTETARFRLAGVVAIGGDVDAAMAPEVPGVSDARDHPRVGPAVPDGHAPHSSGRRGLLAAASGHAEGLCHSGPGAATLAQPLRAIDVGAARPAGR